MKKLAICLVALLGLAQGAGAQTYSTTATPSACTLEGWADKSYVVTGAEVGVEVSDATITLRNWMNGGEGYDLVLGYDREGRVTSFAPYFDGEAERVTTAGMFSSFTHNPDFYYYTVDISEAHAMAVADAEGGYVLLEGVFNGPSAAEEYDCYYVEWSRPDDPEDPEDPEDSGEDAIDAPQTDTATAVYYSLQGLRLASPARGQVVIVHQGDTKTKTLLR